MQFARVVVTVELADAPVPAHGAGAHPPLVERSLLGGLPFTEVVTRVSFRREAIEERRVL